MGKFASFLIERELGGLKSIPWEKTTDHGWWGDQDHVTVYHGTHDKNIQHIAKGGVNHKDPKTGMISVTMDPHTAHGYASMSGSGGEANFRQAGAKATHTPEEDRSVVKIRLPRAWLEKHMDKSFGGNTGDYKKKLADKSTYDKFKSDNPHGSDHSHYSMTEFRVGEAIPKRFIEGVMKKKTPNISSSGTDNTTKTSTEKPAATKKLAMAEQKHLVAESVIRRINKYKQRS